MATTVDNLLVRFGADFRELMEGFREAEGRTAQFRSKITGEFEGLRSAIDRISAGFREAVAALGVGFGIHQIIEFTRKTFEWAEQMENLSKQLRTSSESIQVFIRAGREFNLTEQQIIGGLKQFELLTSQAALGRGRGWDIFRSMGLSLKDVQGDFDTFIRKFISAFQEFNRPSQLQIARQFFNADDAARWVDFLSRGSAQFDELMSKMRETRQLVPTEETAKLSEEFRRVSDEVNTNLRKAIVDLEEPIRVILKLIRSITSEIRDIGRFGLSYKNLITIPPLSTGPGLPGILPERPTLPGGAVPFQSERGAEIVKKFTDEARRRAEAFRSGEDIGDVKSRPTPRDYPISGNRTIPAGGAASAGLQQIEEVLARIRKEAETAIVALSQGPKEAAWEKYRQDLEKVHASQTKINEGWTEFQRGWDAKGKKALQEFGQENDHLRALALAEASGRRDLMEVLKLEYELRKKFGDEFVNANKAQIEALAQQRYAIEENTRLMREAWDDVRGEARSAFTGFSSSLISFSNTNETVWQRMRNTAIRVLENIANKLIELSLINPLQNWLFGGTPGYKALPTISDLWGSIGSIGSSASSAWSGGDILGGAGDWVFPGFASGGQFTVGGQSGIDTNQYSMRLTRGERVTIETPDQIRNRAARGGGGMMILIDAREASNPAAVEAAAMRGIAKASPHLINASVERVRDRAHRDPNYLPRR